MGPVTSKKPSAEHETFLSVYADAFGGNHRGVGTFPGYFLIQVFLRPPVLVIQLSLIPASKPRTF
jgi:hypothetical protein